MKNPEHKTTSEDFDFFKECAKNYIDLFNLNDWTIYFFHQPIKGSNARIIYGRKTRTTSLTLNEIIEYSDGDNIRKNIQRYALHEVAHLLIARLARLAGNRDTYQAEIDEELEAVVNRIEHGITKLELRGNRVTSKNRTPTS